MGLRRPGRPGWFPTQVPHRSGSAPHKTSFVTMLIPAPGRMDIGDQDLKTENLLHDDVCAAGLLERESAMSFHSRRRSRPSAQTTHRPRGGTCRERTQPRIAQMSACPLAFEVRGPSPATTTRGDRVVWSRSSHGSARNETRASAPTCSCSPSGILRCETLPHRECYTNRECHTNKPPRAQTSQIT